MKKSLQFLVMAALLIGAASCNLLENIEVSPTIKGSSDFVINVNEAEGLTTFSRTRTVNMRHDTFKAQEGNVDGFTIEGISVQVANYIGSEEHIISDLELYYTPNGTAAKTLLGTIVDIDLHALSLSGAKVKVDFTNDKAENEQVLKAMILDTTKDVNEVDFIIEGKNASGKAIKADLQFIMDASMKVSIIGQN